MVRLWTILLISGAVACSVAWTVLALREKGLASLQSVRRTFRNHSRYGKAVLGFVFCGLFVLCATKPQGGGSGNGERGTGNGGTNNVQMVNGPGGLQPLDSPGTATNPLNEGLPGEIQQPTGGGTLGDPSPVTDAWADFTPITSPNTTRTLDADDFRRGFVMTGIGTDETFDFSAPDGASVCADWQSFGAADDWTYAAFTNWEFRIGTNWIDRLRIHSDGWVETVGRRVPTPPDGALGTTRPTMRFWPFVASLGIVPQANWPMIKGNGEQGTGNGEQGAGNCQLPTTNYQLRSLFWHFVTPSNTLQMTWQNILLERTTNTPVNVQMEIWPSGRFTYRYDLSRLGVGKVTNILVGASLGILDWTTNALPTNVTSLAFHQLFPEDAVDPDRDGDGASTIDEIFVHGTDPGLWDTDFDGISDGDEVAAGVNPHARDTDGDSFADGTDVRPLEADPWADADGDGLPDAWRDGWFGTNATVAADGDANADGISNLAALMMGVNPVSPPAEGFAVSHGTEMDVVTAWEIVPAAFSFARPGGLTNLVSRTISVNRESPWEQFFVSSRPDCASGWGMSDAALLYGLDGEPATNAVPSSSTDSWRIPLGDAMPQTISFRLDANGDTPGLSSPLYILRWVPRIEFLQSPDVTVIDGTNGHVYAAAKRNSDTGTYAIPFRIDMSGVPCRAGNDGDVAADLALSPVEGVAVTNGAARAFTADDPLMADLPREGTNLSKRLLFYSIEFERVGAVSSGPRASRYASPYPLTSSTLRKSFHVATGVTADGSVTLTLSPDVPELDYITDALPMRGGLRLFGAMAGGSKSGSVTPPVAVTPSVCGGACSNDTYHVEENYPDDHDRTRCEDDLDRICSSERDEGGCGCGEDGGDTELGSFRIRIPFGERAQDEMLGYLWAEIDGPALIAPPVFGILAAPEVTAVTNADGTLAISCTANGGKTLMVTNIAHGVAIPVWNASGRFESRWEVWNEGGDASRIRVRKVTVLGNATVDETYATWMDDAPVVFGATRDAPSDVWEKTDNIRGVAVARYGWRDESAPDFIAEEYEETRLGGDPVRAELRTYAKVGAGSTARRRLAHTTGYDENGQYETVCTYWCDTDHMDRHARLRSVRSDRQAWSWLDYDDAGRETVRIEQFDGSPFPALAEVSLDAALPPDCSAKITVTGYEPQPGDDAHRNDSFEPREISTYVRRGGETPVLIAHETRLYTRETDVAGNPLRRIVKSTGLDGAVRTETTVEYPQDSAVPSHLRGLPVYETASDGTASETAYALAGPNLIATTRRYGPPHLSQPSLPSQFPTYSVTVSDAAYRLPLREETRLSANDAILEWSERTYDDVRRLRSVSYSDGTCETNAYSCCRLLWRRDREGRKVLRSAQTGTDSLYNADEDVWLADVSTNGTYRIVQHFFDGFGRETNTVTYVGTTPGEAVVPSYPSQPSYTSRKATAYLDGDRGGHSESTDERGKVTERWRQSDASRDERFEYVLTNGIEVVRTATATLRNGGSSTRREWPVWDPIAPGGSQSLATAWSEERRFTEYDQDGRRVAYVVTESPDCGTVTNSISTYDLLGRIVSIEKPCTASGESPSLATAITSNSYDGASSRILSSTYTAGDIVRTTTYLYNDFGEQVGMVMDGITNRTDVTYAEISNEWWRVETTAVIGPHTNSLTIVRVQLTGLSDACRRHTVELVGRVVPSAPQTVTETFATFDPSTGIETETVTSSIAPTVTRRRMYGLLLSAETEGTTTYNSYDALGRVAATSRTIGEGEPLPLQSFGYSHAGDLIAKHTYTNGTDIITESYSYDMLGNRIATTDALGNTICRTYDPLGNVIDEYGATYPVRYTYDTAGRRTSLSSTRDGVTWDTTTWTYDPCTSLCTSKTYADNSTVTYTYTPDNLPLRTTYASGRWKENVYDERRQAVGTLSSDGQNDATLQRDAYGRIVSESNNAASAAYALANIGTATNETLAAGTNAITITRTLDAHDRLNGLAIPSIGYLLDYAYADDGLFASISNGDAIVTYAYTSDRRDAGYAIAFSGGGTFICSVTRDPYRREIVTGITNSFGGISHGLAYGYDALSRPVTRNGDAFVYSPRGEVESAMIDGNSETHGYDFIGNSLLSTFNGVTNTYTANNLNQYVSILRASASLREISHDADGNMTDDGVFTYTYDSASRLTSVSSNGVILVTNQYDGRGRRVRKITQTATHTFFYDGWNLIYEHIANTNGTVDTFQYFWGRDLSGSLQGAGGVGGLLYVKYNGTIYVPHADAMGNILRYTDTAGNVVAAYTYDAFGKTISATGTTATVFRHRFSTKYYDKETGLYYYGYRFYLPSLMRWLNRDPIEEAGGWNLYGLCGNSPVRFIDAFGLASSLEWNTTHSERGLLRESLSDFLDGGESKTYMYEYPDSATTRLLGHSSVKPIWQEFKSIKKPVSGDYSISRGISYTARFKDFVTDVKTVMGLSKIDAGSYDLGVNVLGSFSGTATIYVRKSKCEKQLKMTIRNVFSIESMFRNPYTRESSITYPFLNPVTTFFHYDITESL